MNIGGQEIHYMVEVILSPLKSAKITLPLVSVPDTWSSESYSKKTSTRTVVLLFCNAVRGCN